VEYGRPVVVVVLIVLIIARDWKDVNMGMNLEGKCNHTMSTMTLSRSQSRLLGNRRL
jgi:hypothetical protein